MVVSQEKPHLSLEDEFLQWTELCGFPLERLMAECRTFLDEWPGTAMPMVEWIANHGAAVEEGVVFNALLSYLHPVVKRPSRVPSSRAEVPIPPRRDNNQAPEVSHMMTPESELLTKLLNDAQATNVPETPHKVVFRSSNGIVRAIIAMVKIACVVSAIFAIFLIINATVRGVWHRDIANEARIVWASRTISDFALNEKGEFLGWDTGRIVFYSHDYTCIPAFRSQGQDGRVLPPPSEWPEQDVETLLVSEYLGCAPVSIYRSWAGYWGDSPWGVLVSQDQEWLKEKGYVSADGKPIDSFPLWVEYPLFSVTMNDFVQIRTPDLKETGGAVGQTGRPSIATALPIATEAPSQPEAGNPGVVVPNVQAGATATPWVPTPAPTTPPFATQTPVSRPSNNSDLLIVVQPNTIQEIDKRTVENGSIAQPAPIVDQTVPQGQSNKQTNEGGSIAQPAPMVEHVPATPRPQAPPPCAQC